MQRASSKSPADGSNLRNPNNPNTAMNLPQLLSSLPIRWICAEIFQHFFHGDLGKISHARCCFTAAFPAAFLGG